MASASGVPSGHGIKCANRRGEAFKRPADGERNFVLTSVSNFPIARFSAFPGDI
jgi:hypothetical protein